MFKCFEVIELMDKPGHNNVRAVSNSLIVGEISYAYGGLLLANTEPFYTKYCPNHCIYATSKQHRESTVLSYDVSRCITDGMAVYTGNGTARRALACATRSSAINSARFSLSKLESAYKSAINIDTSSLF